MGVWNHLDNYSPNKHKYNNLQNDILCFLKKPINKEIFIVKYEYNYNYNEYLQYDDNCNLKLMIKRTINKKNVYKNIKEYRGNSLKFNENYTLIWKIKTKKDINNDIVYKKESIHIKKIKEIHNNIGNYLTNISYNSSLSSETITYNINDKTFNIKITDDIKTIILDFNKWFNQINE